MVPEQSCGALLNAGVGGGVSELVGLAGGESALSGVDISIVVRRTGLHAHHSRWVAVQASGTLRDAGVVGGVKELRAAARGNALHQVRVVYGVVWACTHTGRGYYVVEDP